MSQPTADLFAALQRALEPQYRLERELGRGGMGVVFLATDTALDRRVAIKVVHPELAAHASIVRRFLAEARTIAKVRHPSIVAVHSAGTADDLLYYVMDEVAGESLRQRIAREGRLPVADVSRIVADLAAALDAAGRAGVVHRDVKPENVLLEEGSGRAMLADFGIARAMVVETGGSSTGQGVAVGTPAYMSPEQAAGEEVDRRSDIYALGVVAYEMLAGHPPFTGTNRVVVSRHIAERPVPIDKARPDCPRPLAAAIMRSLEKQPNDRWQSGEELRQAIVSERVAPVRSRKRQGLMVAAVIALAAVGTTLGVARRNEGPPAGVNPRHSMLILPFDNLRKDQSTDWMREGSVSMLGLNLAQWNDLTVVDHERMHDLLAKQDVKAGDNLGLEMARRLARDAGVWTVVLGDFTQAGDSLHLVARVYDVATGARVDVARVDDRSGDDVRPLFDQLAAKLLDLSGAPNELEIGLARSTTQSLAAYRAYLTGVERLNRWDLAGAESELGRAVGIDSAFGLAYYKLALTRGWLVGTNDSIADQAMVRATAHSTNLPVHDRTVINAYRAFIGGEFASARDLYQQLLARDPADKDAWYGLGEAWYHDTTGVDQAPAMTQALRAFRHTLALDPDYALAYDHVQEMLSSAATPKPYYALVAADSFALAAGSDGRQLLDSVVLNDAVGRARTEALSTARTWVSAQPTTLRAHGAMVDAYVVSGNYAGGPGRGGPVPPRRLPVHPELPFVEARIRFASGDVNRAAAQLRTALDTVAAAGFPALSGHADGGLRHRRGGQRLRLPGRPGQRRQGTRPRRPGPPGGGGQAPTGRDGCGRHGRIVAAGGARRAVCGRGRSGIVAQAGVAERGRGGTGGAGREASPPRAQRGLRGDRTLHRTGGRQHRHRRVPGHVRGPAVEGSARPARAQPGRLDRRAPGPGRAGYGGQEGVDVRQLPAAAGGPGVLPPGRLPDDAAHAEGLRARHAPDRQVRFALGDVGPGAPPARVGLRAARPPGGGSRGVPRGPERSGAPRTVRSGPT